MRCASAASSALLVTPAPLVVADGWREGGARRASTTAGRRSTCRAPTRRLRWPRGPRPTSPPARPPLRSLIFGLRGLLARTPAGFRIHVEAPWLETLCAWLDGV